MRSEPHLRSFRSFAFNVRALGPRSWLRCALTNAWRTIRG